MFTTWSTYKQIRIKTSGTYIYILPHFEELQQLPNMWKANTCFNIWQFVKVLLRHMTVCHIISTVDRHMDCCLRTAMLLEVQGIGSELFLKVGGLLTFLPLLRSGAPLKWHWRGIGAIWVSSECMGQSSCHHRVFHRYLHQFLAHQHKFIRHWKI